MKICSPNPHNYTLTWLISDVKDLPEVFSKDKDGFPAGKYASYYAKKWLFDSLENIKRWAVCRYVWTNKTGELNLTTGRYDGAIGMLADGLADTHFRVMEYGGIDEKFVRYMNKPFMASSVSPLQLIRKVTNQKVDGSQSSLSSLFHFLIPSTEYLTFALSGCLIYWIVSRLFFWFKRPADQRPPSSNLQTKIVSFFFGLFLFYILQFFGNSLNTQNVMVPTDDLLYSREQILKTRKEFCFGEKSTEVNFLKNAPVNSLLKKIYEKRNKTDPCYLVVNNQMGNFIQRDPEQVFSIITHVWLNFLMRGAQTITQTHTYIQEDLEIYQSIRTFLIGRGVKREKKEYFERCLTPYIENGFAIEGFRSDLPNSRIMKLEPRGGKDGFLHFDSLQAYIKEHTRIEALSFEKLVKRGGDDGFVHYAGLQEYIDANTEVTALPFDKFVSKV